MTKSQSIYKNEKEIPENFQTNQQYLEYVKLLGQYFEIKNDEEKLQRKFNEITTMHQKLAQSGIIVI